MITHTIFGVGMVSVALAVTVGQAAAQRRGREAQTKDTLPTIEIYGFAQGDLGHDFKTNDQNWFDVNRPSKLPAFQDEFGGFQRTWLSPRQTRFGVKALTPTKYGDVRVRFEFDLFGVGVDAGQTTIRLRYGYGQWGRFGAGQLPSQFMDNDVFPNVLDYWGPNGMLFFRNTQVFWQVVADSLNELTFALERPGASADQGRFSDRIELQNILARFPAPDITAGYRRNFGKWGHAKLSAIVRWMRWDDVLPDTFDLSGGATGWGVSLGGNLNVTERDVFRLQANGGRGVENYYNDAPIDVGPAFNFGERFRPVVGRALPIWGMMAYYEHTWDKAKRWMNTIGYSRVNIDNSNAQLPEAFRIGQYGGLTLLHFPTKNVMFGAEFQWGYRHNFEGDWRFNDYRIQTSFKYSYGHSFGGGK
jgi:hypothetical protein